MAIKDKKLFLFILITGFSGITAQLLFFREMLVLFYGNEFTLGIILANWLLSEALGSFYLGRKIKNYNLLITLFILSLFFSFILLRNLKNILKLPFGQVIPLHLIFLSSFFILLPISIFHGALFTTFAKHLSSFLKKGIAFTYLYETIGTLLGGLFFTIFLIRYFTPLKIIALIIFLNLIILFLSYLRKWLIILPALFVYLFFLYLLPKIEIATIKTLWQNRNVIYYHNSLYGNITVLKDEEQYTVFHNGIPIIVSPLPFIQSSQDFIHLPLLLYHQINNKDLKILFISSGVGGNLKELKRYENLEIDYLEIDPEIFKILRNLKSPLIEQELNMKGLKIYHLDARYFLRKVNKKYDLIYLGLKEISDLTLARFFTKEFFLLLKSRLKADGFFIFSLPGSLTYLPFELRLVTKTLLNTLKTVFKYALIIPGDENIFISSDNAILASQNLREIITAGLKYLKDKNELIINESYLKLRLKENYFHFLNQQLKGVKGKINADFLPIALYYFLAYFNSHFSPILSKIFLSLERINFSSFLFPFLLLFFLFNFLKRKKRKSIAFLIFSTGFYTLLISLLISFSFQIAYGYLYYQLGFLTTALMVGFALGGYFGQKIKNVFYWLFLLELLLIFLAFLFFWQIKNLYYWPPFLFILLAFITGFLGGGEFPLASELYEEKDKGKIAGILYSADLAGGFLAGILGSSFLIPLFGIQSSLIFLIGLKIISGFFLVFNRKI